MFPFADPTSSGLLQMHGALNSYRSTLHMLYLQFARMPNSAFTLLDAFDGIQTDESTVRWIAYPQLARKSDKEIDENRFDYQEEYVEWRVERNGRQVQRITFTTAFPEYYAALASVGANALVAGIRHANPEAQPTNTELFGSNFNPDAATPDQRVMAFSTFLTENPWNNGTKGILVLSHPSNTLPALFALVASCGVVVSADGADAICAEFSGACVPGRNSDPSVCEATQMAARADNVLSLKDSPGVEIKELRGIWKVDGKQIDINDETRNAGVWQLSHNNRRAVLDLSKQNLTIGDDPIESGAQVATQLEVGATLVTAANASVPAWARTGQESSRRVA
jgi:hypothetical protein